MSDGLRDDEATALAEQGWFIRDGFLPATDALAAHAWATSQIAALRPAGVGHRNALDPSIRGDLTRFVKEHSPLHLPFLDLMEQLNASLALGLQSFQVQLGHYPGNGALYVKHLDSLPGPKNTRRVTGLLYLNPDWRTEHGGHLRLHLERELDVEPLMNRLVVFLSQRVEHEVRPTFAPRLAVTAWYRVTPWDEISGPAPVR